MLLWQYFATVPCTGGKLVGHLFILILEKNCNLSVVKYCFMIYIKKT